MASCCSGVSLRSCFLFSDISPTQPGALGREPPYTLAGANELFPGNDIMTMDKGEDDQVSDQSVEVEPEPGNYWKEKSAFCKGSIVSLAVGERFSSDVLLVFRGRRRCSGDPDVGLQEALRTRLRVVESNSQDVIQLFKDLSARLLSIHAEKDCFVITFKTVEEIWKFSTYLSLGYVARCLENFLCDQTFWLDSARLSDVEICVTVDEEHLATLYLGLLLQDGSFFAKALYNSRHAEEEDLVFRKNDLVMVRDTGQETAWEGTLLKSGEHGLMPVHSMQPLPYPFYQWFFRKYPGTAGGTRVTKAPFEHPVATGTCVAVVDHNPLGLDELQFGQGDLIEVVGFLLASLDVFIGRHFSSGLTGFVQKTHVRPENVRPLDGRLVFLSEEERAALSQLNPCNEHYHSGLLSKLSTTDISTVYRLDRLDESDFPYIKNQPKQELKPRLSARQSVFTEKSNSPTIHSSSRLSVYASQSLPDHDSEALSFSLDDLEEDPALFLEEVGWEAEEAEACGSTLALLDHDGFRESYLELYDLSYSFLGSFFQGVPEEELLQHLEVVREAAKNRRMPWALRRTCFLLARLCAKKSKYSQARVYLEEALRVPLPGFRDLPLLTALYTGLTAIYLKQKLEDKLPPTLERACALLLALPEHRFGSALELELLKLAVRRAVVESDRHLEARACFLALRLHLELGKTEDALPFAERLQFLTISLSEEEGRPLAPVDLNWMLSRLYHRKYLPHLSLASLSLDSAPDRSVPDAFQKIELFIKNSVRLNPQWREGTSLVPAQIVVYLQQALSIASRHGDLRTQRDLCMSLACIYQQHGALEMAVQCAQRAGGHMSETGGHIGDTGGLNSETEGQISETGGHIGDTGGLNSETEGHISETEGHISETGGHNSETGGHISENGGDISETGGPLSETEGLLSETGGPLSETGGHNSETRGLISQTGAPLSDTVGLNSETGGQNSETGGPLSETGGHNSETGGHISETGGHNSETGAHISENGGDIGETGGPLSETGGLLSETGGHLSETGGHISETGGHNSETEGHIIETGCHFSETGGHNSETEGHISETGGPLSENGGHISETGGHNSETGGPLSQNGGHNSETGGHITETVGPLSVTWDHISETGGHNIETGGYISETGGHNSETVGPLSETGGPLSETWGHISEEEGFEASIMLAWLLVLTGKAERAAATLEPLLQSLNETDSPAQRGVVYNLLALCLRKQGRVPEAGRHFYGALQIARENGNKRNEALVLANLGCLALSVCAPTLAERFLLRALALFRELADCPTDAEHAQALLWLGRSYRDRGQTQDVRLSYETALLIAIGAKNLHSQMVVAKALSHLYSDLLLHGQRIIYYEHCVALSRDLKDKRLEGEYLEILSNLYLSLNTEKSSRKSLDYTKQSLRISIDLGKREEESETWLQVGRIYYLIKEDELTDMYLQAAVKTALRVNDPYFAMSIYEKAGDVYFQGHRNRLSALPFYRDGSLPFARSVKDVQSEFRLLSKLAELLMSEEQHEAALQYAFSAVQVSTTTGDILKERTAFHRLATVYYSLQQFELAENYYLKSLSLSPPLLELPSEAQYFVKVYCRLGDLTLHKLKDAFDAVRYLHLALAAALVDRENPRALYRVYRKLAEIYATNMPDAELSRSYTDSARALRDELAREAGENAPSPRTQADGTPVGEQEGGTGAQNSDRAQVEHFTRILIKL